MDTPVFSIIDKKQSLKPFALMKDSEEITAFAVKSEGLSNLVELFYEKKITLEDFGTGTRILETAKQIPLYTKEDVDKGFAHIMEQQTMEGIYFNIRVFSTLTIVKDTLSFPSFVQGKHSQGIYTFLVIEKPVLKKINVFYKFSPIMSEALYTVADCINAVYLFYNRKKITSDQRDMLLKQIETLPLQPSASRVKN
jgi:hypothetical protein